jgi:hypothetical protein
MMERGWIPLWLLRQSTIILIDSFKAGSQILKDLFIKEKLINKDCQMVEVLWLVLMNGLEYVLDGLNKVTSTGKQPNSRIKKSGLAPM